ncbi:MULTISPECIES: NAD(+) diphosphatase [Nocardioides]|uniref:NAD(+) diphosphatase n=1 Tax=Nocardioides TaxID=1839 RepID=UPI0003309E01|nr:MULTISPECIES: NAD(+) diphosphatase [Nocardioides]EON24676.1 NUDIX hydrolase [Nocardioides sp. CF8]
MTRELPHVALSAHAHDREGMRRTDEAWLAERWAEESTRVLVLAGTRLRPVDGAVHWIKPAEAPEGRRVLLGHADGVTRFAVIADPGDVPGERDEWIGLRGLFPRLVAGEESLAAEIPWLFHAIGLAEWHWATRFCPRCGGGLESTHAGHELTCTACGKSQFPRTDPAVIMAVTSGEPGSDEERILLGRQASWPEGRFSTLAGFCEPGETLEDAVRREVMEETGVLVGDVAYFGNQPWPLPGSLMLGFTARALTHEIEVDGTELAEARWFSRADLRGETTDSIRVPSGVSISSSLMESWLGESLVDGW